MKIKKQQVKDFISKMKLDMEKYYFDENDLLVGMNIELEHGYIDKTTNVTNNNIVLTGKIALAHLYEFPDYYKRLVKLEENATKYWKHKNKTKY